MMISSVNEVSFNNAMVSQIVMVLQCSLLSVYHKALQTLSQNTAVIYYTTLQNFTTRRGSFFITKHVDFITNAPGITKCIDYYKSSESIKLAISHVFKPLFRTRNLRFLYNFVFL